jgi:hypothetical protein
MKVTIQKIEVGSPEIAPGWYVEYEGKAADGLGYDEMIGLVSSITMPLERPCMQWLKTPEERRAWAEKYGLKTTEEKKLITEGDVL